LPVPTLNVSANDEPQKGKTPMTRAVEYHNSFHATMWIRTIGFGVFVAMELILEEWWS
jgi:hypothetical protein